MWGIIPAAGNGTRIQPLAFSKELLPVGSRTEEDGSERPKAVRWAKAKEIISTWIITIPGAGIVSILTYFLIHLFSGGRI